MPKKPNSSGQDQEYVPAGNGDPSGEYADEQGGNRHFEKFESPKKTTSKIEIRKSEITGKTNVFVDNKMVLKDLSDEDANDIRKAYEEENKKIDKQKLQDNIATHISKQSERNNQAIQKLINETNEEAQIALNKYFEENNVLKIEFGNAGHGNAGSASSYTSIITNHDVHTIRHETGHTYDAFYLRNDNNSHPEWGITKNLSTHYIDEEEGKTFNQVLHEEIGMHTSELQGFKSYKTGIDKEATKKEKINPIFNAYNEYGEKLLDKATGIEGSVKKIKQLSYDIYNIEQKTQSEWRETAEYKAYDEAYRALMQAEKKYADEQFAKGAWRVNYNDSPDVVSARAKRNEAGILKDNKYKEMLAQTQHGELKKQLQELRDVRDFKISPQIKGINGIIGDIQDYAKIHGEISFSTNGHGSNYFYGDPYSKTSYFAHEIFANMFDIYCSKDDDKKETLKQMLPRTYALFERIMAKYGRR